MLRLKTKTNKFISLAGSRITVSVKITGDDGTDCAAESNANVIPEMNFMQNLFNKISMEINGHKVHSINGYSHHAYPENLLDMLVNEKKWVMRTGRWLPERLFGCGIVKYASGHITSPTVHIKYVRNRNCPCSIKEISRQCI